MERTIGQLAAESGVTVRTLHHYDKLGLLRPSRVSEAGYRYYNDAAAQRLWDILFYRELDFPLKEIPSLLLASEQNRTEAVTRQIDLLRQKRQRLDRLIAQLTRLKQGESKMDFDAFELAEQTKERETYAREAREIWGKTQEYAQSEAKREARAEQDEAAVQTGMEEIFRAAAALVGTDPAAPAAQALVARWQRFITDHYYTCTDEILKGLGEMYTADDRFRRNMDRYGEGTAAFLSAAIRAK